MEEQPKKYTTPHGDKTWYLPSKGGGHYHRLDGPAVEFLSNGLKQWYVDGRRHRIDGPAVEREDGSNRWYIDGKHLPKEEVEEWLEENDVDLKTESGQMAFKLRWS